ncbi:MAG: formylglycine-generating enzyme family protein [Candidatus Wallbacteria bacterium]|nr:formylglycine-generating enzyme family protein [Candidatus Wallbacteria bacterium]
MGGEITVDLPEEQKLLMVWIPAGSFVMGSPENEPDRGFTEGPQHPVSISRGFYLGKFQVTQAQWLSVMDTNPSCFAGMDLPVENISFDDCLEFIENLNRITNREFRLPTEAEWEYACRAGSTSAYCWGDSMDDDYCWHAGNSDNRTHAVGGRKPNAWGLHDMSGNVEEWCQDWFGEYSDSPAIDPAGPVEGMGRVFRGGGFCMEAANCRSAERDYYPPDFFCNELGLRLIAE